MNIDGKLEKAEISRLLQRMMTRSEGRNDYSRMAVKMRRL
jgi:hypothetical protein